MEGNKESVSVSIGCFRPFRDMQVNFSNTAAVATNAFVCRRSMLSLSCLVWSVLKQLSVSQPDNFVALCAHSDKKKLIFLFETHELILMA